MSNPEVKIWFPVPVYHELLECDIASLQARVGQIYEVHHKQDRRYPNGYTTFNDGLDLKPTFQDLCANIHAAALRFCVFLGVDLQSQEILMDDFWLNYNRKDCHHAVHNHPNSFISGVFYVTSPEDGGNFVIHDPKLNIRMYEPRYEKNDIANFKTSYYVPMEKLLILFPSYLMHEVEVNRSDEMRISISFNFVFKKN
jgi:uncharacterized protein (TIGR02466 family)